MMSAQNYMTTPAVPATMRPMTEQERTAFGKVLRPVKANAIGMALVSMLMAVMINFVTDEWLVIVPAFFGIMALGMAFQARKLGGKVAAALARGNVADVRVAAVRKGAGGSWDFGAFSVPRNGILSKMLSEGMPASVCVEPESKQMLSVNGVALGKPLAVIAYPHFASTVAGGQSVAVPQAAQVPASQEPPPPPNDWDQKFCAQCGQRMPTGAAFCSKCGYRSKM